MAEYATERFFPLVVLIKVLKSNIIYIHHLVLKRKIFEVPNFAFGKITYFAEYWLYPKMGKDLKLCHYFDISGFSVFERVLGGH